MSEGEAFKATIMASYWILPSFFLSPALSPLHRHSFNRRLCEDKLEVAQNINDGLKIHNDLKWQSLPLDLVLVNSHMQCRDTIYLSHCNNRFVINSNVYYSLLNLCKQNRSQSHCQDAKNVILGIGVRVKNILHKCKAMKSIW